MARIYCADALLIVEPSARAKLRSTAQILGSRNLKFLLITHSSCLAARMAIDMTAVELQSVIFVRGANNNELTIKFTPLCVSTRLGTEIVTKNVFCTISIS